MNTWFVCKVKYLKEGPDGSLKSVSEQFLVDAMSFTEAEARIYDEIGQMVRGEFTVTGITKSKIADVFFYDDSQTWHKCKISYALESEEGGKEKKITQQMLVSAPDVKTAYDRIYESLNNMLVTFKVPEVVESPIVEIFPYISEEEKNTKIPDNLKPLSEVIPEMEQ